MKKTSLQGVHVDGHPNLLNVLAVPQRWVGERALRFAFRKRADPSLHISSEIGTDLEGQDDLSVGPLIMVSGDLKEQSIAGKLVYACNGMTDLTGAKQDDVIMTSSGPKRVKEHDRILTPGATKLIGQNIPCEAARQEIEDAIYDAGSPDNNGRLMHLYAFITDAGETVVDSSREIKVHDRSWTTHFFRSVYDTNGESVPEAELINRLRERQKGLPNTAPNTPRSEIS